jgi:hypothetical protein
VPEAQHLLGASVLVGLLVGLAAPRHRFLAAVLGLLPSAVVAVYWERLPRPDGVDRSPELVEFLAYTAVLVLAPYIVGVCLSAPLRPRRAGDFRPRRGRPRVGDLWTPPQR